jgi:hypothetical protein
MQNSKAIDITRSYVPVDPNSFPETMHGTGAEDTQSKDFLSLLIRATTFFRPLMDIRVSLVPMLT